MTSPEITAASSLQLLERARLGDTEALNELLSRYLPVLRQWARGRFPEWARRGEDTDDLIQEATLRTLQHLESFEPRHEGALQAYLRCAVMNRIRDAVRRPQRLETIDGLSDDLPAPNPTPLEVAVGHQALTRYEAALARLRPDDAAAVIGRVEFGQSFGELMRVLAKPSLNATRVAVSRAVARLALEMDRGPK